MEDIDHIFEKGGITGGVFTAKGGRTVVPHQHILEVGLEAEGKVVDGVAVHVESNNKQDV